MYKLWREESNADTNHIHTEKYDLKQIRQLSDLPLINIHEIHGIIENVRESVRGIFLKI